MLAPRPKHNPLRTMLLLNKLSKMEAVGEGGGGMSMPIMGAVGGWGDCTWNYWLIHDFDMRHIKHKVNTLAACPLTRLTPHN